MSCLHTHVANVAFSSCLSCLSWLSKNTLTLRLDCDKQMPSTSRLISLLNDAISDDSAKRVQAQRCDEGAVKAHSIVEIAVLTCTDAESSN
jgi:hypothetical protein